MLADVSVLNWCNIPHSDLAQVPQSPCPHVQYLLVTGTFPLTNNEDPVDL